MGKNIYQSELMTLGPVRVKVKTDVMASKFKGKPNYVVLEMDGAERNYTCENEACEAALRGLKGRTIMIEATGSREEAAIKVLGAGQAPEGAKTGRDVPQNEPEPPNRVNTPQPPQKAATGQPKHEPVYGPTAGMAVNNAIAIMKNWDAVPDPNTPEFYRSLHFIASNIARVGIMIENGNLAPTAKEVAAAPNAESAY